MSNSADPAPASLPCGAHTPVALSAVRSDATASIGQAALTRPWPIERGRTPSGCRSWNPSRYNEPGLPPELYVKPHFPRTPQRKTQESIAFANSEKRTPLNSRARKDSEWLPLLLPSRRTRSPCAISKVRILVLQLCFLFSEFEGLARNQRCASIGSSKFVAVMWPYGRISSANF
jgi:hypothetical protein